MCEFPCKVAWFFIRDNINLPCDKRTESTVYSARALTRDSDRTSYITEKKQIQRKTLRKDIFKFFFSHRCFISGGNDLTSILRINVDRHEFPPNLQPVAPGIRREIVSRFCFKTIKATSVFASASPNHYLAHVANNRLKSSPIE